MLENESKLKESTKLIYITKTSWWDTDITLIPLLKQQGINLNLIVITSNTVSKYSEQEINEFCNKNSILCNLIQRKRRIRNISNLMIAFKVWNTIRKLKTRNNWIFYEYITDPYLNLLMLLYNKNKLIISFHNYREHKSTNKNVIDLYFKWLYFNHYNYFHFHSEEQYDIFSHDYPNKKSFYTIMPLKDYGNEVNEITKVKTKRVFLFFGYIEDYKNLSLLITSVESLNRSDIKLIIAGYCSDFSQYDKIITKRYLYDLNIRFIDNKEIPNLFNKADYLVLPYKETTQSGPFLIALNYNLPVIASNVGSFPNLIENRVDGLIFDSAKRNGLAETLTFACEMTEDYYQKIKRNQKQRAVDYFNLSQNNGLKFIKHLTLWK